MTWVTAGDIQAITRARKTVIDVDGYEVLVLAHDGNLHAFQNRCIHKQRELAKGVVLNGKLVCPGRNFHVLVGFFNAGTINEWRTPNTIVLRLYGRGDVVHWRGVTGCPGLYFLGLPWLHTWGSGRLEAVGRDAAYLADRIADRARPADVCQVLTGAAAG